MINDTQVIILIIAFILGWCMNMLLKNKRVDGLCVGAQPNSWWEGTLDCVYPTNFQEWTNCKSSIDSFNEIKECCTDKKKDKCRENYENWWKHINPDKYKNYYSKEDIMPQLLTHLESGDDNIEELLTYLEAKSSESTPDIANNDYILHMDKFPCKKIDR